MQKGMPNIRQEVLGFVRECERLLGFAHENGGLNEEECQLLSYYTSDLTAHASNFCEPAEPHRPTRG